MKRLIRGHNLKYKVRDEISGRGDIGIAIKVIRDIVLGLWDIIQGIRDEV